MTYRHNELWRNTMPRINRGIDTMGAGTVRQLCIAGIFSLLFLMATGTPALAALKCTDCHNSSGIPVPHDNCCQETSCAQTCHPKDLNKLVHPGGPNTPLSADRTTTCRNCHDKPFPGVYHPYKINNVAGSITPPGIVDLDQACGQCHGGGPDNTTNPPKSGIGYFNKTTLAAYATGIHNDKPTARFTYAKNGLAVNVDASATICLSDNCSYSWNFGDLATGSGVTASHTYAAGGAYDVTLTAKDNFYLSSDSKSVPITVTAANAAPTAICTPTVDGNNWKLTIVDGSTDDAAFPANAIKVNWGDGSPLSTGNGNAYSSFGHSYLNAGTYNVSLKAVDAGGLSSTSTCGGPYTFSTFQIGGKVTRANGTTAIGSALVTLTKSGFATRTTYTASNGTYSFAGLKPGTYTVTVTKAGLVFPAAPTATVGASQTSVDISSTTP